MNCYEWQVIFFIELYLVEVSYLFVGNIGYNVIFYKEMYREDIVCFLMKNFFGVMNFLLS